jgi:polyhydroxyalkanoate synthesis regulator phasin
MAEERSGGIGEGIRTGIGILNAFKEAIEETLEEAIARGEMSPERARIAMREAAERLQTSVGEARERFDFVSRREHEALQQEVAELRGRLDRLERGGDVPRLGSGIPVD